MLETKKQIDNEDDIGYLIWKIMKFWQRGKHRILDEYGITASQMEVMGAIYKRKNDRNEVTQILLSQDTDIDPMTVSTIIRNLQKKGLITRKESETDTRARVVELTEAGQELFEKAVKKVKKEHQQLYRNIDTKALRTQLCILLDELNEQRK
ncbi:MAG TPA: MarR family transcriptional regulator [Dysgonomonas sp.]|nr:MarR family transcriptional regulator [Dysgonomonas sp.]